LRRFGPAIRSGRKAPLPRLGLLPSLSQAMDAYTPLRRTTVLPVGRAFPVREKAPCSPHWAITCSFAATAAATWLPMILPLEDRFGATTSPVLSRRHRQ